MAVPTVLEEEKNLKIQISLMDYLHPPYLYPVGKNKTFFELNIF